MTPRYGEVGFNRVDHPLIGTPSHSLTYDINSDFHVVACKIYNIMAKYCTYFLTHSINDRSTH